MSTRKQSKTKRSKKASKRSRTRHVQRGGYLVHCQACGGNGGRMVDSRCGTCGGSGTETVPAQPRLGVREYVGRCGNCGGSGNIRVWNQCGVCGGLGMYDAQQPPGGE